jgi:hypothetical protein
VYGIVTRSPDEVEWEPFDRAVFEVGDSSGMARDPVPGAVAGLSCFVDRVAAEADPDLLAVDAEGTAATATPGGPPTSGDGSDAPHAICPTSEAYRDGLLSMIDDCTAATPDVRLAEAGFPGATYCHCERCDAQFAASEYDDRADWRVAVVVDFVDAVREVVPGDLSLVVHPDPYPGHLRVRSGVDLDRLAHALDEVVVPLYDTTYDTTYWVETLASGFADATDLSLGVELYAGNVSIDPLLAATAAAEPHADTVYFGYGADTARAALRRRRAEGNQGREHRPE